MSGVVLGRSLASRRAQRRVVRAGELLVPDVGVVRRVDGSIAERNWAGKVRQA